jgi:hypothetical protein
MMQYIKRRFTSEDLRNESTDNLESYTDISYANQNTEIDLSSKKEKSKLLFVIDDQRTDW